MIICYYRIYAQKFLLSLKLSFVWIALIVKLYFIFFRISLFRVRNIVLFSGYGTYRIFPNYLIESVLYSSILQPISCERKFVILFYEKLNETTDILKIIVFL